LKSAYLDTSALAAILFEEQGSTVIRDFLSKLDWVYSSNLLEAEMRSAMTRENLEQLDLDGLLSHVKWVLPERPLTQELRAAAACGIHLRGADLWHVACALFLAGDPSVLPFVTLDQNQALAAARLGFKVLPEPLTTGTSFREPSGIYSSCPEQSRTGAVYKAKKPQKRRGKKK
jgi:PIN domain nuclease of toxin-antitoxin system